MSDANRVLGLCETVRNMVLANWSDKEILGVFEESDHDAVKAYLKVIRTPPYSKGG